MLADLQVDKARIEQLCRGRHIRRLALFGSVLRDDFTADSDVDVLVEFEPGRTPGLAFFEIEDTLSEIFGRRVELHTAQFLSPHFRGQVQANARVVYDKAG